MDIGALMRKRARLIGSVLRARSLDEKVDIREQFMGRFWPQIEAGEITAGDRLCLSHCRNRGRARTHGRQREHRQNRAQGALIMPDPRMLKLADLLVHYCTSVQPGDWVLVRGHVAALPLVEATVAAVVDGGRQSHAATGERRPDHGAAARERCPVGLGVAAGRDDGRETGRAHRHQRRGQHPHADRDGPEASAAPAKRPASDPPPVCRPVGGGDASLDGHAFPVPGLCPRGRYESGRL